MLQHPQKYVSSGSRYYCCAPSQASEFIDVLKSLEDGDIARLDCHRDLGLLGNILKEELAHESILNHQIVHPSHVCKLHTVIHYKYHCIPSQKSLVTRNKKLPRVQQVRNVLLKTVIPRTATSIPSFPPPSSPPNITA